MSFQIKRRPVVLCVLDGWGLRAPAEDNATSLAHIPCFRAAWDAGPHAQLQASEGFVGLPAGQIGNSEVGHMNLGAGRVVFQDLPRIDRAIEQGSLAQNPELTGFIAKLKASGGVCHLMGLASPGGVHAHQDHIVALARIVAGAGVPVAIHAFLDGRDVPPQSARAQIEKMAQDLKDISGARIASLCGRFFAMDRDKRWDRVAKAYELLVEGTGAISEDPVQAVMASYRASIGDEFVEPVALAGYQGMKDSDGILCANFRADRAREILTALLDPDFDGFQRSRVVSFAAALGMVEYSAELNRFMPALFPPHAIKNGLGEFLSQKGLRQLRIAETEKYPHVTFFFNGGREDPFPGEDRQMIPSPSVRTYDLKPEMSAFEVTDKVCASILSQEYDFILLNFANADMVGHTGFLAAAVKALEALDLCLARLFQALAQVGGLALVTADHGNCEMMADNTTHGPHTAHTLNPVPVFLVGGEAGARLHDGKLADVAPTILALMGLTPPPEMEGASLLDG